MYDRKQRTPGMSGTSSELALNQRLSHKATSSPSQRCQRTGSPLHVGTQGKKQIESPARLKAIWMIKHWPGPRGAKPRRIEHREGGVEKRNELHQRKVPQLNSHLACTLGKYQSWAGQDLPFQASFSKMPLTIHCCLCKDSRTMRTCLECTAFQPGAGLLCPSTLLIQQTQEHRLTPTVAQCTAPHCTTRLLLEIPLGNGEMPTSTPGSKKPQRWAK